MNNFLLLFKLLVVFWINFHFAQLLDFHKHIRFKESLFRITSRPSQITEEEVTISKEKKICLVCKNKVSRLNYICPECDALYCVNCSNALGNAENACWVCNEPFDESKPSKSFKDEMEDIKISSEKE